MNVLVIPEDFRKDQYILKPIIKAMFGYLGKPKARIDICNPPLLGGVGEALKWSRIEEILEIYPTVDVFLLCIDRDGNPSRHQKLRTLEQKAAQLLSKPSIMIAENAWQELEVWTLAGHELPKDWSWKAIRADPDPKEMYFLPFAEQQGFDRTMTNLAYKRLSEQAASRYKKVRQRCPEDIAQMEDRINTWLTAQ
ncbi:MAG: hypothetical protein AAF921_19805 [Cyanobacteria bacterium P01_D01_bin.44]